MLSTIERVLALQRTNDRHAQPLANRPGQTGQQRVGKTHHVRLRLIGEEREQLVELPGLAPRLAPQHRHGQLTQL